MSKIEDMDEFKDMTRGERLLAEGLAYLLDCECDEYKEMLGDADLSDEQGSEEVRFIDTYGIEDTYNSEAAENAPSYGEE